MNSIYLMCPDAARHEMSRRLRNTDDQRQRRLARRSFRRTNRAEAGTMWG